MNKNINRKLLPALLITGAATIFYSTDQNLESTNIPDKPAVAASNPENQIQQAFKKQQSDIQIKGKGVVVKILPDDTHGISHQRFILKPDSSPTILVAHNIDLAPKIRGLQPGDLVEFYGEYEWNDKGGVIHWTHRDPSGRHLNGWLKHKGRIYD